MLLTNSKSMQQRPPTSSLSKKKNNKLVYDCTVEDIEYIYNKLSIHIFNSKSRLSML